MDLLNKLHIKPINFGTNFGSSTSWITDTNRELVDSINPTTGETIAQVYASNEDDYETVLIQAEQAFLNWRKVPAPLRGELVRLIGEELRLHKDELGSLVSLEMGKIKAEGDGEVQEMIDMADFAVGQSRMLYGKTMHSERPEHRMYEQWHPLGIVGVMSAFNFPVAVWAWNAFIAAICGNITIWKPSPKTPLTAIAVQHICNNVMEKAGYPGIFHLFVDSPENKLASKFVEDHRVKKLSFTGSTVVGRMVGTKVAERMGKCLLELSGNNAIIVDESANLNIAIPSIVFGAVGTAGQRCTTTRRLIVQESIAEDVINKVVSAYKSVRIGNPLDNNTLMGPLIDQMAINNYTKAINDAVAEGGEVLYGGKPLSGAGTFVEPTVIRAENHYAAVQCETFAPILYVMTYQTLDEAITMQNSVRHGLSSALFTNKVTHAEKFLSSVGSDCGIANINIGTSGAEIGGAFGGEKETGGGREAGSDAWKAYMRRQTNTTFWGEHATLAQGITFDLD
ncbi:MAG TPA: aldehyde dehydrogenase family protein [Aeromonadales bacterium]|nr:aldehyde dehydrogenase family protein [Aeromonadales bacterium]